LGEEILHEIETRLNSVSDIVIDGGLLLEYFNETATELQNWLNDHVFNDSVIVRLHGHEITRAEVYYITCRTLGHDKAKELVDQMKDYIEFHGEFSITEKAGQVKCGHSIALADCFAIATGIFLNCPILFKKEEEMTKQVISSIQEQFNVSLLVVPLI